MIRYQKQERPRPWSANGRSGYWTSSTPARWRWLCCSTRSGMVGWVQESFGTSAHVPAGVSMSRWMWACSGSFEQVSARAHSGRYFSMGRDWAQSFAKSPNQSLSAQTCRKECNRVQGGSTTCKAVYLDPRPSRVIAGKRLISPVLATSRRIWSVFAGSRRFQPVYASRGHYGVECALGMVAVRCSVSRLIAVIRGFSQSLAVVFSPSRSFAKNCRSSQNRSLPTFGGSGGIRLSVMQKPWGGLAQAGRGFLAEGSVLQNAGEGDR